MKTLFHKKEIRLILIAFILLTTLSLGSKFYSLYHLDLMNNITTDIYTHPLKVSNAALNVQLDVYKMHRDMKDVVLSPSAQELAHLIVQVDEHEARVYSNMDIIAQMILGKEGALLQKETLSLFKAWRPIRDNVITLVNKGDLEEAISITKKRGADHVLLLDTSAHRLYLYAQDKADHFKKRSDELFEELRFIDYGIAMALLLIFSFVAYYTVSRLSRYIHHNRRLNRSLADKSKELETIIQEAPNPMVLHNDTGEFILINKAWLDLTGYTFDEIDTMEKWAKKAARHDSSRRTAHIEELYNIRHKVDEGEFEVTTRSGKKLIWQFSSAPLGMINGKRTLVSSATDITELKQKDELMIAQSRQAAMGDMINMIAHQWRQPLAVIAMGANNMLVDIELDDLQDKAVEEQSHLILDQAKHLTATIDDFRTFFQPDKEKEKVKIGNIIDDALKIVGPSLKNNAIELFIENDSTTEISVHSRELIQVFLNLLSNAKDAMVAHTDGEKKITIKVTEDSDYLMVSICDNGGGIGAGIIEKVFEPYFTTKKDINGTGLGLYMSKTIINKHFNGTISVKNQAEGACFTVSLQK